MLHNASRLAVSASCSLCSRRLAPGGLSAARFVVEALLTPRPRLSIFFAIFKVCGVSKKNDKYISFRATSRTQFIKYAGALPREGVFVDLLKVSTRV